MRFAIVLSTGDPRAADLAQEAEAAGWDGVFTWDAVAIPGADCWDPWVVLAAMAMRAERVTLGAMITPPSRRRPWKLARCWTSPWPSSTGSGRASRSGSRDATFGSRP